MKELRLYLSFQLIYTTFDFSIPGMFLTISQQNAVILRSTNNNCIRKFLIIFNFHSKTSTGVLLYCLSVQKTFVFRTKNKAPDLCTIRGLYCAKTSAKNYVRKRYVL